MGSSDSNFFRSDVFPWLRAASDLVSPWFAPLPVLLAAPKTRSLRAFVIASVTYTIGGINMWHYYRELVPLGVALLVVLGRRWFLA
jgi:hypothetical protein